MENNQKSFYQLDNDLLKFDWEKDNLKVKFAWYIMRKENFQRLNGELERGYFKITARTVASDLKINIKEAHKLIKEFEKLEIIKPIFISKSKKESSIYCYVVASTEAVETAKIEQKTEWIQTSHISYRV